MKFICIVLALLSLGVNLEANPAWTPYNKNLRLNSTVLTTNGWSNVTLNQDNEDATLTVPDIIAKYGYPVEVHNITTEDGYILEAHRIPWGKKCPATEDNNKRVIWLQHGLLGDSSNWILSGVDRALAYELADNCYDVWLGNFRGNTYSRNHVSKPSTGTPAERADFWKFSWHQMGIYDLPASIDYALNKTGATDLYYIGHSMGTTAFWVCMSERPEYNTKIKLMSAFAPVAYMGNLRSYIRLLTLYLDELEKLADFIGLDLILPSDPLMDAIGRLLCQYQSPTQFLCSTVLFLGCGFNEAQLDRKLLPILVGHSPAGSSTRAVIHYGQEINSLHFRQYDFGNVTNLEYYGQEEPPSYNLSKITAPVAFYYAENDFLADKSDVLRLSKELPNLQRLYRIDDDRFNHIDFIIAIDQHTLVNMPVMEFMDEFALGPTTTTKGDSGSNVITSGNLFWAFLIFKWLI